MTQPTQVLEVASHAPGVRPARLRSLDGLRGVAALVVLVHHAMLTFPVLAGAYFGAGPTFDQDPAAWLATYTPVHLLWVGSEAVFVFFLLSGLVLTLPAMGRGRQWWLAYYPRRVVRLYVPVLAAVVLGYLTILAVPRTDLQALGPWLADRPTDLSLRSAVLDLSLIKGISGLISPLWSLHWEVWFSLLLPVFVLFAVVARRLLKLKLVLLAVVLALGELVGSGEALYLPMFAVGALMATEMPRLRSTADRIDGSAQGRWVWRGLAAAAVVLCSSAWMTAPLTSSTWALAVTRPLIVTGAALLVFLAAFWSPAERFLESRACQWLGLISFSLYLVHEPLIIAAVVLGGAEHRVLALAVAVPLSLAVAAVFYRLVERPSTALARSVGKRVGAADLERLGVR